MIEALASNTDLAIKGINIEHEDFGGRATLGQSFIKGSDGEDDQGHGSHCSGIAAGTKYGVVSHSHHIAFHAIR